MLNINPEIVCDIIAKAREFHAKEGVSFSNSSYDADWSQILADHKDDLTYQEVKSAIDDLEPDQQMTLVALMYIGRGDYTVDEWDEAYKEAEEGWTNHTADYLLSKPLVADYLQEGLSQFGYSCD
ncbi:MAG: DUF3775 domain-containing protein [Coxiellaceae bacterium]|nr:MAG: DUF3775 domain-containing protein [Coxiellaceae bacterium]